MENVFQYLQIYLFIKTHQFDFCPKIFEKSKKNTYFYQFPSLRGACPSRRGGWISKTPATIYHLHTFLTCQNLDFCDYPDFSDFLKSY